MIFRETLLNHAALYPKMQPCDAVKLAYQSCLGPEHMIQDESLVRNRLMTEYNSVGHVKPFRTEVLGRFSRVYIDSPLSLTELELIGRMFANSAKSPKGDRGEFSAMLATIESLADEGAFAFTKSEFTSFCRCYIADGCPPISHSSIYKNEYNPAYRLVDTKFIRLISVIFELAKRDRAILAIDGRAASGKTTAAQLIAHLFDGEIVHLDDFFLPLEMRTPERLSEPGGNLDRERFKAEVLPHVNSSFSYRVFDCSTGTFKKEPRNIRNTNLLICEGTYSLHPAFGSYFDLALFSTTTPEEQKNRILSRNGEEMWKKFRDIWIPMEEKYFEAFSVAEKCKFVL